MFTPMLLSALRPVLYVTHMQKLLLALAGLQARWIVWASSALMVLYLQMADPELGPRPQILFQQQLYDVDTAALLLPAYLGNQRAGAADVDLIDQHRTDLDLTNHAAEMNWLVELHQLALAVHERYRHLWRR